ncbi:hypothetical protein [Sporomusa sp.]|uniref:hypothetical protein n=1 Tax=Sporomusa sp. TaxID=2078658 RepID=UPI002CCCF74C|nr:hypothetical protein [Sporomusa sp.]HWR05864.1 hypothetical protein [Sporomusa sp.]
MHKIKASDSTGIGRLYFHGRSRASIDKLVVDSLQAAVKDADIISTATSGTVGSPSYPYFKEEWIKPGELICFVHP